MAGGDGAEVANACFKGGAVLGGMLRLVLGGSASGDGGGKLGSVGFEVVAGLELTGNGVGDGTGAVKPGRSLAEGADARKQVFERLRGC